MLYARMKQYITWELQRRRMLKASNGAVDLPPPPPLNVGDLEELKSVKEGYSELTRLFLHS